MVTFERLTWSHPRFDVTVKILLPRPVENVDGEHYSRDRVTAAKNDPKKLGIFGSSAGAGMVVAMILRAKEEASRYRLRSPIGTPWVDLTETWLQQVRLQQVREQMRFSGKIRLWRSGQAPQRLGQQL